MFTPPLELSSTLANVKPFCPYIHRGMSEQNIHVPLATTYPDIWQAGTGQILTVHSRTNLLACNRQSGHRAGKRRLSTPDKVAGRIPSNTDTAEGAPCGGANFRGVTAKTVLVSG